MPRINSTYYVVLHVLLEIYCDRGTCRHILISEVVYIPHRNSTYYVGQDQEHVPPRIYCKIYQDYVPPPIDQ